MLPRESASVTTAALLGLDVRTRLPAGRRLSRTAASSPLAYSRDCRPDRGSEASCSGSGRPGSGSDANVGVGACSVLRIEVPSSTAARDYTRTDAVTSPGLRAAVARTLLDAPHTEETLFCVRDGSLRIAAQSVPADVFPRVSRLGECSDTSCGCHRPTHPAVRQRFRDYAAAVATETLRTLSLASQLLGLESGVGGARGLRFVGIGSGELLTEFELLCAAREVHQVPIESISLIDISYKSLVKGEPEGELARRCHDALDQLAAHFAPARVHAFGGVDDFLAACKAWPETYCGATLCSAVDASSVPNAQAHPRTPRLAHPNSHLHLCLPRLVVPAVSCRPCPPEVERLYSAMRRTVASLVRCQPSPCTGPQGCEGVPRQRRSALRADQLRRERSAAAECTRRRDCRVDLLLAGSAARDQLGRRVDASRGAAQARAQPDGPSAVGGGGREGA